MGELFEAYEEGFGKFIFFLVKIQGEVVGVRFVDFCLEGSTKTIRCVMYLEMHNIYLRTRYDG